MPKNFIRSAFILLSVFSFAAAAVQAQPKFVANVSNLQVVPPTASNARAVCSFALNSTRNGGTLTCNFSGLSSGLTAVRIHGSAPVGENAPAVFDFPFGGTSQSGGFATSFFSTAPAFSDIYANRLYLSFATVNFPSGEIRGQLHLAGSAYNDFDGDGRTDLTVYRNSNRSFYAQSSLDGSLFERAIGQPGDSVSLTVDFDGDGRSDFSTAAYNGQFIWRIFESATETLRETPWGFTGDFFAAGDYDGDGRTDIAVFRGGTWIILESSTGNARYEQFGQAGDVPAPNDFDGDGRADLAVARSESGKRVWYVKRSSDGEFYSVQWGLSSDAFFTGRADYDGDGRADISVIRNESGKRVFYILRSSDNQLQSVQWGLSSDLPKLGDYDGDGKTDLAVTRGADGVKIFAILQSSNNEVRYETFGLASDF